MSFLNIRVVGFDILVPETEAESAASLTSAEQKEQETDASQ